MLALELHFYPERSFRLIDDKRLFSIRTENKHCVIFFKVFDAEWNCIHDSRDSGSLNEELGRV